MLNKLKQHTKTILIIELVVVYFFTLSIILLKHSNDDVDTSGYDNILFKGESYINGVTVGDGSISFNGQTDSVREYSEVIDLRNVYAVDVSFSYEYPAQTRDTGIFVDLFNADYGYDRNSQQFVATMTSGTGNVNQRIVLDNDHPDNASVRFTYVDNDVNFKIADVKVSVIHANIQDTVFVLYVIDGILAAITAVTALFWLVAKRDQGVNETSAESSSNSYGVNTASEKKIDYRFKLLYAIGMFLVVANHCGDGAGISFFKELFPAYGFHIGLFVFCSGYFYKEKAEGDILGYIWKKIKSLIIPLYLWNFAYALIAQLMSLAGFTIGAGVTLEKLFLMPIYDGHQFWYNLASWFIFPLFMAEVFNVLYRKCLSLLGENVKEFVYIIGAFALGIMGLWLSAEGYNTGWWLALTRFLHFIPFYCAGYFYNKILEKRDNLPNTVYFAIVIGLQLGCILYYGDTLTFAQAWSNFHGSMVWPYIIGFLGIAFWLRIAKIAEPAIGKSRLVNLVADNTVSIMNNHLLSFKLVCSVFALFYLNTETLFRDFDLKRYLNDVFYCYFPRNLGQASIIYIAAGFAVSLLIALIIKKCKKKILASNKKCVMAVTSAAVAAVTIGFSFLISGYVSKRPESQAPVSFLKYSYGTELQFTKENNTADNYCVSGFSGAEDTFTWTEGNEAVMKFTVPETTADLKLDIVCGTFGGLQNVEFYVNDNFVCKETFEGDSGQHEITIPNEHLSDNTLLLKMVLPDAASPSLDGVSGDTRVLALSVQSVTITEC